MTKPDQPSASDFTGAWYVAHTKPRQERTAVEHLARQGYRVYLPQLKVLRRLGGVPRIGFEPLFPRYLFFQPAHSEHSIAPVRSTFGVSAIVRAGGMPAVLRTETIDGIRVLEARQRAADVVALSALEPGKAVVVASGPLAGLEGLVAMLSRQRVVVLMRLLGEDTKVTLSPEELRLVA